jgi:hypothetical protein
MYDFVIKQLPDIYTTPVSAIKFWMQLTKTGKWFNIELDTLYETSTKTDVWKINVNVRRSNATKYSWYLLENKVIDETPSSLEKTGECILTSTDWGNAKVVDTSERYINFYDKDDSLINLGFYLSPYEWPNVSFFVESAEANT